MRLELHIVGFGVNRVVSVRSALCPVCGEQRKSSDLRHYAATCQPACNNGVASSALTLTVPFSETFNERPVIV